MSQLDSLREKWESLTRFLHEKNIMYTASLTYSILWNTFLVLVVLGLLGGTFAAGVGAGFFASLVKDEPVRAYASMKKDIYNYEETSRAYFSGGEDIGAMKSDLDRTEIPLAKVSPFVKKAVIATEDEYFHEHEGVVPKAIMRAMFQEFTGSEVRSGGSTLTQQLIKNQILTNEVSFDRKAKEILLAMRLEKFFKKEEILEAYLNVVPYGRNSSGNNVAGIQAAAQGVFGVNADKLNLAQAAYLTGLPQNPFVYTPYDNSGNVKPEKELQYGINRMQTVLKRMLTGGHITEKEYSQALSFDLRKSLTSNKQTSFEKYPYITYEVEKRTVEILSELQAKKDGKVWSKLKPKEQLEYKDNASKQMGKKGLKIYTTLNKKMYEKMQQTVKNNNLFHPALHYYKEQNEKGEWVTKSEPEETGGILIENKTGAILSFVGGRDFNREQVNHAMRAPRQNGSTMKPLLAYSYSMELGKVQPGTIIPDAPLQLGDKYVGNWDGKFKGLLSVRESLKQSRNTPAIRSYLRVNSVEATNKLIQMGFSRIAEEDRYIPSMAIGGMTIGATVEENTNAFATFANGGQFVDAYMIEKIETNKGELLYQHKAKAVPVFSPQTSYLTIDMMRDVLSSGGTAAGVKRMLSFSTDWAGKTGTTNEDKDSWFVATNPNVTLGVWLGYDHPAPLQGRTGPRNQAIWAALANDAYSIAPELMAPKNTFAMPSGIVRMQICGISGKLPSDLCRSAGLVTSDLFNAKFTPNAVDDTLMPGRYVIVGDEKYKALESTPEEFTKVGVLIKEDYLKELGFDKLTDETTKSNLFENVVPEKIMNDNGSAPAPVAGSAANNGKLSWAASGEKDVIGYRVYHSPDGKAPFKKIASVTSDITSAPIPSSGIVYVTAVDIAGRESGSATKVTSGPKPPAEPPKPEGGKPGTGDPPPTDPPPAEPNNGNPGKKKKKN
ncbi:transglycosylase domain-containing protein [Fictibacillus iocasae]|uniref:Transglycosylase domain-containing protein n=1 Tax=Fictibacillus iocasae TaxID=2715437 RepID=A0ABW2NVS4_9BACL